MCIQGSTMLALTLMLAACGGSARGPSAPAQAAVQPGLQIKLTTVYVDDQDKALRFYTEVLGFSKKDDVSNSGYRWLTVTDGASGGELQLARDDNPAGKAYQQALFQQGQPAVMFYTDDIKGDHERISGRGGAFAMPPTDVTASIIAQLNDGAGNLVQITELKGW
jgi:predicted enzyme related to lactoylglutathione lyase